MTITKKQKEALAELVESDEPINLSKFKSNTGTLWEEGGYLSEKYGYVSSDPKNPAKICLESVETLFKTGKTLLCKFGLPYVYQDEVYTVKNGYFVIWDPCECIPTKPCECIPTKTAKVEPEKIIGIQVDAKHNKFNKDFPYIYLLNGDEMDGDNGVEVVGEAARNREDHSSYGMPISSFILLSRLNHKIVHEIDIADMKTLKDVRSGVIRVVDYTTDHTLPLSTSEKNLLKMKKENQKESSVVKRRGYTLVNGQWHQSGYVLFYNSKKDETYLVGQDEGTYFGVILPQEARFVGTVYDALEALKPEEVRSAKEFQRQGEWFVLDQETRTLPTEEESIVFTTNYTDPNYDFVLEKEKDGNPHHVCCADFIIGKDGYVYARHGCISHDEHEPLDFEGWVKILKNTAVTSYSQNGVD